MSTASLFEATEIEFRCGAHHWDFVHENAALIDAHWAQRLRAQPKLFDGQVFLATDVSFDDGPRLLRAKAFATSFRTFLAWRDYGFPGHGVFNLFSMAALQSCDGAFLLGEMAPHTSAAGRLYFPAGTPDLSDVIADHVDLAANVRRELEEETGIPYDSLTAEPGWRIVKTGQRIACMKPLLSQDHTAEIVTRFNRFRDAGQDPELAALIPVRTAADIEPHRMPDFMTVYLQARFAEAAGAAGLIRDSDMLL